MKIIILGQKDIARDLLKELLRRGENIVSVFGPAVIKDKKDSFIELAKEKKIPNFDILSLKNKNMIDFYKTLNADICLMAFVTDYIPKDILDSTRLGTIQYHPSLLPYHKGPSAISWAIKKGRKETGVTIFWANEELDGGDILLTKICKIEQNDTLKTLFFKKLFPLIISGMLEGLELVKAGNPPRLKQNKNEGSYEGWFTKDLAEIDWNKNVNEVHDLIRAADSVPGAWSRINNFNIDIFSSSKLNKSSEPGKIISITDEGVLISAKDGSVLIKEMKTKNQPKMQANKLLESLKIKIGEKFKC